MGDGRPECSRCGAEGVPIGVDGYFKCPNDDCRAGVNMKVDGDYDD